MGFYKTLSNAGTERRNESLERWDQGEPFTHAAGWTFLGGLVLLFVLFAAFWYYFGFAATIAKYWWFWLVYLVAIFLSNLLLDNIGAKKYRQAQTDMRKAESEDNATVPLPNDRIDQL